MLIYFNGDSFTAGVHLFDRIFPNYPGFFTSEELITRKREIDRFSNIKGVYAQKFVDHDKLLNLDPDIEFFEQPIQGTSNVYGNIGFAEKKLAFPAQLEKLDHSIKTINAAVPGASINGICFRTVFDLLELQAKGIKVDQVIIQITSFSRYEIYTHTHKHLMYDRPLGNFKTKEDNNISNAVTMKYDNKDYLIKYLYNLMSVQETVRSITGKELILIDSDNSNIEDVIKHTRYYFQNNDPQHLEYFDSLLKHSRIENTKFSFMGNIAKSIPDKGYVYDGHYSQYTHNEIARQIRTLL